MYLGQRTHWRLPQNECVGKILGNIQKSSRRLLCQPASLLSSLSPTSRRDEGCCNTALKIQSTHLKLVFLMAMQTRQKIIAHNENSLMKKNQKNQKKTNGIGSCRTAKISPPTTPKDSRGESASADVQCRPEPLLPPDLELGKQRGKVSMKKKKREEGKGKEWWETRCVFIVPGRCVCWRARRQNFCHNRWQVLPGPGGLVVDGIIRVCRCVPSLYNRGPWSLQPLEARACLTGRKVCLFSATILN